MKSYQKPVITDILLEEASTAEMQGAQLCVGRDARAANGGRGSGTACGTTMVTVPGASAVMGCDGNMLYPTPDIVLMAEQDDALAQKLLKGFQFTSSYECQIDGACVTPDVNGGI